MTSYSTGVNWPSEIVRQRRWSVPITAAMHSSGVVRMDGNCGHCRSVEFGAPLDAAVVLEQQLGCCDGR